jgi:hypothetical protein
MGSTCIHPRRESLMEYMGCSNQNILDLGNKLALVIHKEEEVDLTLATM